MNRPADTGADDWMVVVPTRNDRPELLRKLVMTVGPDRMVLVHTTGAEQSPDIEGCLNLRDEEPLNIQAWWATGIKAAGSRYVALVNDDVEMETNIIPMMVGACWKCNRAMARVRGPGIRHSGWLFVIDTDAGVAPDPAYRWWYGDDDMYRQAELRGGIIDIPVANIKHYDLGQYGAKPEYWPIITADRALYFSRWKRWEPKHG